MAERLQDDALAFRKVVEDGLSKPINMHHGAISSAADGIEDLIAHAREHYGGYPVEPFKNVDNTPKHLLHMTAEDMKPKPPAVVQEELQELIKEAKSKIKPVLIEPEDRRHIITAEEFEKNLDGTNIDPAGLRILKE